MAKRNSRRRLARGELEIFTVKFSKAELAATPPAHRSFYILLGQIMNEIMMLQSLLVRSIGSVSGPRPEKEANLGLVLFVTRLVCGRIVEAYTLINSKKNGKLLSELWQLVPESEARLEYENEANAARQRLNKQLGPSGSLMRLVRNKLAYHLDQTVLDATFDRLPDDLDLADFHTGRHGTTFFGVADTVAALAVSELTGEEDMLAAVQPMAMNAMAAVGDLQAFSNAFLFAFNVVYFGAERLMSAERLVLKNLPEVGRAKLGFFLALPHRS